MATLTLYPDGNTDVEFIYVGSSIAISSGFFWVGNGTYKYASVVRIKIPTLDGDSHEITSAYLNLVPQLVSNGSLISVTIGAESADNAARPTSYSDFMTALGNQTTALVTWTPGSPATGVTVMSEDITDIIQEIINRSGWAPDNYIALYFLSTAPTGVTAYIQYNGDVSSLTPQLVINYEGVIPGGGSGNLVSHDLSLEQFISFTTNSRSLYSEATVVQTISVQQEHNLVIESVLAVIQDINYLGTKEKILEDELIITQDISYSRDYNPEMYSDVTVEQDILVDGHLFRQIISTLDPLQDIVVAVIRNKEVIDDLDVIQDIHVTPIYVTVTHSLTPLQDILYTGTFANPTTVEDVLDVIQEIGYSGAKGRTVESVLVVSQLIMVTGTLSSNSTSNTNTVSYPITYGAVSAAEYQTRDPANPTAPPLTPPDPRHNKRPDTQPTIIKTPDSPLPGHDYYNTIVTNTIETPLTTTVLEYPIVSPTSTVTLPSPLFGNREELQVTRIQRKTLGGDLKILADSNWPKIRTLRFQFEGITDSLLTSYNTFIMLSLGLEIKLTDYEGRVWHGFIVTPETESTDTGPTTCDNTLGFEFIGVEQ